MSQTNNTTNVEKLAPAIQEESKQDKSNTLIEDVLKLSIKSGILTATLILQQSAFHSL